MSRGAEDLEAPAQSAFDLELAGHLVAPLPQEQQRPPSPGSSLAPPADDARSTGRGDKGGIATAGSPASARKPTGEPSRLLAGCVSCCSLGSQARSALTCSRQHVDMYPPSPSIFPPTPPLSRPLCFILGHPDNVDPPAHTQRCWSAARRPELDREHFIVLNQEVYSQHSAAVRHCHASSHGSLVATADAEGTVR